MLYGQMSLKLSPYSNLYDILVPQDNILRKIKENVDFSFVNDMVADSYCAYHGRPAKEPEMMFKLLFLKTWYDLSDRELIENARVNMAYKYFLDLNPEDEMVDSSLLTVFRKTHINGEDMMNDMIGESIRQAVEKGIIKNSSIIVDSTHTNSKAKKETPTKQLRRLTKNIRKEIYKTSYDLHIKFPEKPEETDTFEDEIIYTDKLLEVVREHLKENPSTKLENQINHIYELLKDQKIKYMQSVVDEDAKIGYKSTENAFFGYKTHIAMTENRMITAVNVTSGEASDGVELKSLIQKTEKNGVVIEEVIGDKAYSSQSNINFLNKKNIKPITRKKKYSYPEKDEKKGFTYNKDADTFACKAGHLAISKCIKKREGNSRHATNSIQYTFDIEKCKTCPYHEGCYRPGIKQKTYTIKLRKECEDEHKAFEETEYFKKKIKDRYKIEAKNSELKKAHGFDRCKYVGLLGMQLQAGLTVFAANIKRMMRLMAPELA